LHKFNARYDEEKSKFLLLLSSLIFITLPFYFCPKILVLLENQNIINDILSVVSLQNLVVENIVGMRKKYERARESVIGKKEKACEYREREYYVQIGY
jgi:hypothetical protein